MSGLYARVFKLSSGVFANARVYAQHKHFAWLDVNSYKEKSLKFQSRVLESPCKVLNKCINSDFASKQTALSAGIKRGEMAASDQLRMPSAAPSEHSMIKVHIFLIKSWVSNNRRFHVNS